MKSNIHRNMTSDYGEFCCSCKLYNIQRCTDPMPSLHENYNYFKIVSDRHIWGCAPTGAMTPKFELSRNFCTLHLPRVSSSYVYSFGIYRVDKQTNNRLYATTLDKKNRSYTLEMLYYKAVSYQYSRVHQATNVLARHRQTADW